VPKHSSEHRSSSAFSKGLGRYLECGCFQEALSLCLTPEQRLHFATHLFIGTGFLEEAVSLAGITFTCSVIKFLDLAPPFSLHRQFLG
jgi:hypothetical protein